MVVDHYVYQTREHTIINYIYRRKINRFYASHGC